MIILGIKISKAYENFFNKQVYFIQYFEIKISYFHKSYTRILKGALNFGQLKSLIYKKPIFSLK